MSENRITSRSNPRIKAAVRLRERKHRVQQKRLLIEGLREVSRAVEAGVAIEEVFVCQELGDATQTRGVLASLRSPAAEVFDVTPEVFGKIAYGDRSDGVIALAQTPDASLERLDAQLQTAAPFIAVLEAVEKPGNLGAILRSADGAGVSAVVVCGSGTDLFNPNAIRASLGTIFAIPVAAATAEETLAWLRARHLAIAATRPAATIGYADFNWSQPAAVVLGSEAHGLSAIWNAADVAAIHLPMCGAADSLNVSAAAAAIFYEALRQRNLER